MILIYIESEMRELWKSFERDSKFPVEAIIFIRIEYYESSKTQKIMEYYIFDYDNLH